jgi:hypothetical protein
LTNIFDTDILYREGILKLRPVLAEFIYELYINDDAMSSQLAANHKNLIIAFLIKINARI